MSVMFYDLARRARVAREYGHLRAGKPDAFRACVETASSIAEKHRLSMHATADIEAALVSLAVHGVRT